MGDRLSTVALNILTEPINKGGLRVPNIKSYYRAVKLTEMKQLYVTDKDILV